jgi:phosphoglycerate dehydrogenase-like enzyme
MLLKSIISKCDRRKVMARTVLSLAPLQAELVKLLIMQTPGVPDFEVVAGHDMSAEEIRKHILEAEVVLGDYTFKREITADLVSRARNLKFIQQPSVGYQHIDVEACTANGIMVANTAGANTVSVAEHTVAWGLCLLKNMFHAHTSTKQGKWEQMSVKPAELKAKVWGLIGFGRIGKAVAVMLKPFELGRILYFDIIRFERTLEQELGAQYCDMKTLLSQSDIISLHVPLNDLSRNMIDAEALNAMKNSAYIINVARAGVVDEMALADALMKGKIAGAGIDVFSEEPVTMENPLLGIDSDRVMFSPHVAGVTDEAAGRIINMAAANIARVLKGDIPESLVNTI